MFEQAFEALKFVFQLIVGNLVIVTIAVLTVSILLFLWKAVAVNSLCEVIPDAGDGNKLPQNNRENIDSKDLISVGGLSVVASSGPERKELPPSTDQITLSNLSKKTRKYRCGHRGAKKFHINAYGTKYNPPPKKIMCPECTLVMYKEHVIRCALCGHSIAPGDPVALYVHQKKMISTATVIDGYALGCLRRDCCPTGGFFSGNWSEQGFKPYDFEKSVCT